MLCISFQALLQPQFKCTKTYINVDNVPEKWCTCSGVNKNNDLKINIYEVTDPRFTAVACEIFDWCHPAVETRDEEDALQTEMFSTNPNTGKEF